MMSVLARLLGLSVLCHGAVLDSGGPTDLFGRPQVDLYDASGSQRGTASNPLFMKAIPPIYTGRVLTGNQTATVKTGSGLVHVIVMGAAYTGGTINLYDGTVTAANLIFSATAGTPSGGLLSGSGNPQGVSLLANLTFNTSLIAVTSGSNNNNFTVVYQ